MGNSNKHKKEQKPIENLNNSVNLGSYKDFLGNIDSNEDLMKSQVLDTDYNFFESLISDEDFIRKTINPYEDDHFLGEYSNDFKVIKLIQENLISKIYKAENIKDKRIVSLKVYNKKNLEKGDYDFFLEQIKREEEIIKLCKSDNIINIYQKIETSDNIIYEMESWDTNLSDYISKYGGFSENLKNFKKIFIGIINALEVLNKNGVMHRDIRPCNLFLIERTTVKLGGFEHAIFIKNNISESVGSIFYAAPEIIKNLEYDEKCDLWSLGITLYELLFNELPYGKNATINMIKQSLCYEDNFCLCKINEYEINYLLSKLMTINRKNRINHKELFNYINKNNYIFEDKKNVVVIKNIFGVEIYDSFNHISAKVRTNRKLTKEKENCYCLNENKFMNKIMDIVEGGYLTDIMALPNGYIDSTKKFNNIIYYDENLKFINSINKDSDFFEKKHQEHLFYVMT